MSDARLAVAVFMVLATAIPSTHTSISALVGAAALLAVVTNLVLRFVPAAKSWPLEVDVVADLVIVSLYLVAAEAGHSPFYFLYAVPVFSAALIWPSRPSAVWVTAVTAAVLLLAISVTLWGPAGRPLGRRRGESRLDHAAAAVQRAHS